MTSVSGKKVWLGSHSLSQIASFPASPLQDDWFQMCFEGLGWPGQQWLFYISTRSELYSVRVRLLSVLCWLSFCFSLPFFSDVSVHQWLMSPRRTWLIFHLQPASQLFNELRTGPHARTHNSAQHNISPLWADVVFGESKAWCITCLCFFMNPHASSIFLSA